MSLRALFSSFVQHKEAEAGSTAAHSFHPLEGITSPITSPSPSPTLPDLSVPYAPLVLVVTICFLIFLIVAISIYKDSRRHSTDAITTARQAADKIPVTVYSTNGGGEESCVICLDDLVAGEEVRVLPRCHHTFHKGCIDRWLTVPSKLCPMCRGPVLREETKPEVSISVTDISVVISINV